MTDRCLSPRLVICRDGFFFPTELLRLPVTDSVRTSNRVCLTVLLHGVLDERRFQYVCVSGDYAAVVVLMDACALNALVLY